MDGILQYIDALYKVGLLIGGAIGIYLAAKRVSASNKQAEAQIRQAEASARQAELGQRKLTSELFKDAIVQLADENVERRLFAVHTLSQIAAANSEDRKAVVALLATYVRNNEHKWGDNEPPTDIQVIMRLLASSTRMDK